MTKFLGKNDKGLFVWECKCDCGNTIIAPTRELTREHIKSCGCLKATYKYKHGLSKHQIYDCWIAMKARCLNPQNPNFSRYGGRGISVCKEWIDSFENFKNWAYENGYKENLTLDRIDNNGNYCPENCRWATRLQQQNNNSRNRMIEYNGEVKTLSEWSRCLGIKYNKLSKRLYSGWSVEKAFTKK